MNKKTMKQSTSILRVFALLLALVSLLSVFVGCQNEKTPVNTDTEDETTEKKDSELIEDELPVKDYGGDQFTLALASNMMYQFDESSNDVRTGEKIAEWIMYTDEVYNIEFTVIEQNYLNVFTDINNLALSGETVYDLVGGQCYRVYTAAQLKGFYQNWNNVPYINLKTDCWNHNINETMTLGGTLIGLSGSLGLSSMQYTMATFFNYDLVEKYGYPAEKLYGMVYDHEWTFDALYTIAQNAWEDLNNDGQPSTGDMFTFASGTGNSYDHWLYSTGHQIVNKADDGTLSISLVSDYTTSVLSKLLSFYELNGVNRIMIYSADKGTNEMIEFRDGRLMFVASTFATTYSAYRETSFDYGILPHPLWTTDQKEYYTNINDQFAVYCVPNYLRDDRLERVGLIVQFMAQECRREIYPEYYEAVLKGRYSKEPDMAAMVDLIMENVHFDFSQMYGEYLDDIPYIFRELLTKDNSNLASYYGNNVSNIKIKLNDIKKWHEQSKELS
ncbi:MAG: hypothetical protein IJW55_10090 [Clostridia bacterium]|nr:hypothetical protein [Clostridia bacterium]MBQ7348297.1 hypothetical protein [Clostridia bacterium]